MDIDRSELKAEFRKYIKQFEKESKEEITFVRVQRTYKIPKSYICWDDLSLFAGISVGFYLRATKRKNAYSQMIARNEKGVNEITMSHHACMAMWVAQKAPLYIIEADLLDAFKNTEILDKKQLLADLKIALQCLIVLLPKGSLISPNGLSVSYLVIHGTDKDHPEGLRSSVLGRRVLGRTPKIHRHLTVSCFDTAGAAYPIMMDIHPDGSCTPDVLGKSFFQGKYKEFSEKVQSLALQTLLTLQYRQDLLEPLPDDAPGTPHKKRDGKKVLVPRILGKQYRISRDLGGTHSSPTSHWRSGFWKRVCVGKGREGREWRWFEPVFVNGHKDKQENIAA